MAPAAQPTVAEARTAEGTTSDSTTATTPTQLRAAYDNILRVLKSKETRQKYVQEHANTQRIIQEITGLQLDTNENGEQILRQVDNPVSMAEYADRVGVSRNAISKRLLGRGITDEQIGHVVGAFNTPTSQTSAATIDGTEDVGFGGTDRADMAGVEADEDIGRVGEWTVDREAALTQGRVSNTLAKAAGEGVVSDGSVLTPAQRTRVNRAVKYVAAAKDTDAALKEVLKEYNDLIDQAHKDKNDDALVYPNRIKAAILIEAAEAIEKRKVKGRRGAVADDTAADKALREARSLETRQRAFAAWAATDGINFAKDWDYYRSRNLPPFAELPEAVQVSWLQTAYNLTEEEQNDPKAVERAQRGVERSVADLLPSGAPETQEDVSVGSRADQAGDGRTATPAKPTVVVRKVRTIVKPDAQEVQAPAAQGPDQPGSQAAELSPAVQAKIDEHKAAIADYEKLLACLRSPR